MRLNTLLVDLSVEEDGDDQDEGDVQQNCADELAAGRGAVSAGGFGNSVFLVVRPCSQWHRQCTASCFLTA